MWRTDGRELFFRSGDRLMAAPVNPGPPFSIGAPRVLVERALVPGQPGLPNYDVARDGQRICLVQRGPEEDASPPIRVIVDWVAPRSR